MKNNVVLIFVALVLGGVSFLSYRQSVTRAERFERGQKFLPQLNADNIHAIEVRNGENATVLRKENDSFSVVNKNGYPAKNETVNRFISDVLNIALEKEVGSGSKLETELALTEESDDSTLVVLKDQADKVMVRFLVGKSSDGGRGSYLKRLDSEEKMLYLSSRSVFLGADPDNYLRKELLDLQASQIAKIEGADFTVEQVNDALALTKIPKNKQENKTETGQLKSALSRFEFKNVYLADEPVVAGLKFKDSFKVSLTDESAYELQLAQKEDKHYLKIKGIFKLDRIQIEKDESEEDLKKKSEILSRADEIQTFNEFHGSWVYELDDYVAKKLLKTKKELIEDKESES